MAAVPQHKPVKVSRSYLLYGAFCLIGLYVLIPQLTTFHGSWQVAKTARPLYMVAALAMVAMTYIAAAGVYYYLALKPVQYWRTLRLQLASMFVNRLLPGGIGNIGVNYLYLRKARHTRTQAASVVAANNAMGFIGHLLLVGIALLSLPVSLPKAHWHSNAQIIAGILIAVVLLLAAVPSWRAKAARSIWQTLRQLGSYSRHPGKIGAALMCSLLLTLSNVTCLWLSVLAVHITIGFVPVLLIFTFGIALGTATPTPGGLGGLEAAMVAGLVAYHVPAGSALAAVLLYRLVSYWLALLVGARMFVLAKRQAYF